MNNAPIDNTQQAPPQHLNHTIHACMCQLPGLGGRLHAALCLPPVTLPATFHTHKTKNRFGGVRSCVAQPSTLNLYGRTLSCLCHGTELSV